MLMQILIRVYQEDKINWVKALPMAVTLLHDLPGVSGLRPYEIVYGGRTRSIGGVPRLPQQDSPDARGWLAQGKCIYQAIAEKLKDVHDQQLAALYDSRRPKPVTRLKTGYGC